LLASLASPIDASKIRRAFPLRPFISICHCRLESKGTESTHMNPRKTTITILAVLSTSLALADDFKTIEGKEYKKATVSGVEPDGILLKTKSGISKVYFSELPKEVQERFHYNAAQAAQFTTAHQAVIEESNAAVAIQQQEEAQERQRRAAEIARQQQQAEEQQRQADAITVRQQQLQAQARHRYADQQRQKATAPQTAERARQRQIAGAVAGQRALEDQRIQRENQRYLENTQRQGAIWMQESRVEWARQQLESDKILQSPHSWIQTDRETLAREKSILEQQKQQQGNRATAY
jgi:hypothetical protein